MKLSAAFKTSLFCCILLMGSLFSSGQNSSSGKAFSDGIWTLVGASNGVELYVTHVKYSVPNVTNRFVITVYGKVVNTTDDNMTSPMTYGIGFRYTSTANALTYASFGMPQDLKPRQTIVKALSVSTNLFEIRYGDDLINPLVFQKR